VKTVVDLHRGDILVESNEGEGSRFIVSIPAPPVLSAALNIPEKLEL
jgi:signal transduction histidine kinase